MFIRVPKIYLTQRHVNDEILTILLDVKRFLYYFLLLEMYERRILHSLANGTSESDC